jgi:pyruvate ferredoxin oxidoreductase gamma subunit
MFQVRFHGRGGQGVVTAAELLASAAFGEDRHAQAFPSFGSERMGAPVMSFCRIDDKPIRTHEPVTEPDALIIQDPTLLHQADLFAGLGRDGYMLVNSSASMHPGLAAQHRIGQLEQAIPALAHAPVQLRTKRRQQPSGLLLILVTLDRVLRPGHTERHGHRLHRQVPSTRTDGVAVAACCHGATPGKPAKPLVRNLRG